MSVEVTTPHLLERQPQHCAVVREKVPMSELQAFFGRAFQVTMDAARVQGRTVVGPPFGAYFGMPTDTVDVAAGFPVDGPIAADGDVTAYTLPGGQAVELLRFGPYESLPEGYDQILTWMREEGLTPAEMMWESYLNEPQPDASETIQTMITWPVA